MPSNVTTAVWITRAKERHGDRYDYSKSEYTTSANKVMITCPVHGDFEHLPGLHLKSKTGCPQCSWSIHTMPMTKPYGGNAINGRKIVYKLYNPADDMSYIGCSEATYARLAYHKHQVEKTQSHRPIYRAIRESGWDNLQFTILHEGDDFREKEREYIRAYGDKCYNQVHNGWARSYTDDQRERQRQLAIERMEDETYRAIGTRNLLAGAAARIQSYVKKWHVTMVDGSETIVEDTLTGVGKRYGVNANMWSWYKSRQLKPIGQMKHIKEIPAE